MRFAYYLSQLACIVPAIALFVWNFSRLRHRDRAGEYILVVLSGAISTIPTIMLSKSWSLVAEGYTKSFETMPVFYLNFFHAFFVVALTEEFCKYLSIQLTVGSTNGISSLKEGMIFGVGASLGFALVENILYGAGAGSIQQALIIGLSRGVTAVPLHGMAGSIIGYAIGRAKIEPDLSPSKRLQIRMEGLLIAIVLHGFYDFFLFMGGAWAWGIIPVLLVMVVMFIVNYNHANITWGRQLNQ
jgi:RsiW-degrading membrane proteinase PrsW (M82 family)